MKDRKLFMTLRTTAFRLITAVCMLFSFPVWVGAFCFEEAGKMYGINPALLQSIARVESGLDSKAVNANKNGSTDLGLMQINSAWIETLRLNGNELLSDPCYNVKTGAQILKGCIDRWGYTWKAVGCYNAVTESKRAGYSWKIYRELKKERDATKRMAKKEERSSESTKKVQSLRFRVRSAEKPEISREP
jgi:hypothetical protein